MGDVSGCIVSRQDKGINRRVAVTGLCEVDILGGMSDKTHQSTQVYNTDGLNPCLSATEYKHPTRVVEIKKDDK